MNMFVYQSLLLRQTWDNIHMNYTDENLANIE